MRTAKRALSLLLCVIMVISLMTIIPVTAFEANAASYNADEVQAQTVSGQQIKIPNVWSARRSIESGKTYTISWLNGNTARLLTLNGNEPGWRDQTVKKGTSGMPYYFNASANANELWTTSRDGGWYWRNNSNNYYLCFNYTGAITGLHDTFRISGQPSKPKNDGTLSGWYTFKDVSTKNAVTGETRLHYGGDASDKVMSFYTQGNYWTAINTDGGLKKYATNTYMFQKQDLTLSIGITGEDKTISDAVIQYKFNLTDNLGGVSHTAVGNTKNNISFPGYTYGTGLNVTWESNNENVATINELTGELTANATGEAKITCHVTWTDNGVNYELVGTKSVQVIKPNHMSDTHTFDVWIALKNTDTVSDGTSYVIGRGVGSTADSINDRQANQILTGNVAKDGKAAKNANYDVRVPLNNSYAPYIRANIDNTSLWKRSTEDGKYYQWRNVGTSAYLAWYYRSSGVDVDSTLYTNKNAPRTSGVTPFKYYGFIYMGHAEATSAYHQYLYYVMNGPKDDTNGYSAKTPCVDANGNWSKRQNDGGLSVIGDTRWLTIYAKSKITVSFDVYPASLSGVANLGGGQLTAKPSENYRYNGPDKRHAVWVSDNPEVASVDSNGYVTYNSEGTATITCYYYWFDELTKECYCMSDTAKVTVGPSYKVTYDANGGSGSMAPQYVAKGGSFKLNSCTFTGPGTQPKFMGWSTTPNGEIKYANGATITPTSDMTLYAIWGYDVTFSSNDYYDENDTTLVKDCYLATITVRRDGGTVISNQAFYESATKNGQNGQTGVNHANSDIVGWMTGRTGEIAYPANTGRLSLDGPITLHAQWQYNNTDNALLTNGEYPVTITCIGPIDGNYPAEPGVAHGYNWHFVNPTTTNPIKTINGQGYTLSTKAEPWTFTTGANVIDPSIFSSPAFQHSINEGGTWGLAGKTVEGVTYTPRQYIALNDDFWNQLRDLFLSDPARNYGIDEKDFDNYELVPYVVKVQHGTSQGWHVDCYLKSKTTVSYTYDVGLNPTEYTIIGGMP